MEVRLVLNSGRQKGRETTLSRGIYLVGRSPLCQIRPKNRYVSRKHCALIHRRRELLIQDLGSRSGTFVNGKKIDPKTAIALADGDRIRVGKTRFLIAIMSKPRAAERSVGSPVSAGNEAEDLSLASAVTPENASDSDIMSSVRGEGVDQSPHFVDDVLQMLESDPDEDEEDDRSSNRGAPGTVFSLGTSKKSDGDEDDSDGNVLFAAPNSGDSIRVTEPLPSYASRKDWDVQSVYSWINQKETYSKLDERRAKRKAKQTPGEASDESTAIQPDAVEETASDRVDDNYSQKERTAQEKFTSAKVAPTPQNRTWGDWLDLDTTRPVVLVVVGVLFAGWIAWNAWILISFKG